MALPTNTVETGVAISYRYCLEIVFNIYARYKNEHSLKKHTKYLVNLLSTYKANYR